MEIKQTKIKTKCDIQGCKNMSKYSVCSDGKIVLCVCEDCLKKLYNLFASVVVPKGIISPYNKKQRRKDGI